MKYRFLIGIMFLAAAAGLIAVYILFFRVTTVSGYIGGSKANLLNDPDVKKILLEKYHLEVNSDTLGGLEQVCSVAPPYDFLWPATDLAVQEYKTCHNGLVESESLLRSPIVLYSWGPVTEALNAKTLVEKKPDGIYYADMEKLATLLLDGKTTWKDVGVNAYGPIAAYTSDPTQSNSGQMFLAMLGKMRQKQLGVTFADTFPDLKKYLGVIGFKPPSTTNLFNGCLAKGAGGCPLFVAYESLSSDYFSANILQCTELKSLQAVYPVPTIWATHPMIAATPEGKKLLDALKDDAIQKIAFEKHGFRSILGIAKPQTCIPIADAVNQIPIPTKEEMDSLQKFLTAP